MEKQRINKSQKCFKLLISQAQKCTAINIYPSLCEQNLMTEIQINKVSLLKPLTGMQDIRDKPLYSDLFET